ncbi:MAG: tRNA 2-thiouridine(34) synthase MnmA [Anaerolineaceae bacterium]|jgi:tRNA-specific 2-thiouridylase|nr:tRNA 2-thiouridine(34) synthase MnmA [Anaerolineaceae bacterium]MDD4043358.1 tRNA 2-thiouridine(34) synthase MnmA [Anaerolineaceae bacterium]MDD4578767.1 tRNA 2-thiouridine(34) synthase MnmA [Anaerolineaceae bacterium]
MKKIVLALSGGVDSAIAAHLLQQQGYQVYGLNLVTWGDDDQREGVQEIADNLGFPVGFLDIRRSFREQVIQPFIQAYQDGLTPSPCVFCNRQVKWSLILQKADQIGAEFVSTGHYARLKRSETGLTEVWKAADLAKDQSYVLTFLTQSMLSRTLLPLGEYNKPQIRELAANLGLAVSSRPDSQDLCFLACSDYRDFLREYSDQPFLPGPIYHVDGRLLGQHQGLAFYTIGQRKGLPSATEALYVVEKRTEDNRLIVGFLKDLGADTFTINQVNWISGQEVPAATRVEVKIRYKALPVEATVEPQKDGRILVRADKLLRDITPGQIAAFYQGDRLLGGGVIE